METRPIITLAGRTIPPAVEEKYDKWSEGAYIPLYMKLPGMRGIDEYKIIKKNFELPSRLLIYHSDNLENRQKRAASRDAVATARDRQITFGMVEHFFLSTYELERTFKKDELSAKVSNETIVNEAPIIHIEGYEIPANKYEKYEGWFNKWASRVYVPLLLEIPGVKACNFFRLVDYKDPRYENVRFVESEMPRFISITYLQDSASAEEFNLSIQLAAFRRNMELEFPGNLKTIWNTEYELFASHRP
jgi:hypothetical protein